MKNSRKGIRGTASAAPAYEISPCGVDNVNLRREKMKLREALKRIQRGESAVAGLRPEFYGHAIKIATEALA